MKNSEYNFSQPYIKESFFKVNPDFVGNEDQPITLCTKVNVYNNYQYGSNDNSAICGLNVEVGEETGNAPFYVRINMESEFSWKDKDQNEIRKFLSVNAPSLIIGYARPIITFLTSNSQFPPFNLAFINFKDEKK